MIPAREQTRLDALLPEGIDDPDWIPVAGDRGWVVITNDTLIRTRPVEAHMAIDRPGDRDVQRIRDSAGQVVMRERGDQADRRIGGAATLTDTPCMRRTQARAAPTVALDDNDGFQSGYRLFTCNDRESAATTTPMSDLSGTKSIGAQGKTSSDRHCRERHDPHPLVHSLARNHALMDGNKRRGWTACRTFLVINASWISAPKDERFDFVIAVAIGAMSDLHQIATQPRS